MKYHEKLNLKSPIYKYNNTATSRTPSKSPIKPAVNPSDLFQKVCCPNCKYAFRIIKQQVVKEVPLQKMTLKNNNSKKQQRQTQTDGILTLSNGNSLVKISKSQAKLSQLYALSRIESHGKSQFTRLNELLQVQNGQNRNLDEQDFKFKPLSVSPKNKNTQSNYLLKTLGNQKTKDISSSIKQIVYSQKQNQFVNEQLQINQFVNKQLQINCRSQTNIFNSKNQDKFVLSPNEVRSSKRIEQKGDVEQLIALKAIQHSTEQVKNQEQNSFKISYLANSEQIKTIQKDYVTKPQTPNPKYSPEFQQLISDLVLKYQQNENIIRQFQSFFQIISQQIEVPSYCKMLALSE